MHQEGVLEWLKPAKKVLSHDIKKDNPLEFRFVVKFFPIDVREEIFQDATLKLIYRQVKNDIVSHEIYCPPVTFMQLASFACQAEYGDYFKANHVPEFLRVELPSHAVALFDVVGFVWEEYMTDWWMKHDGEYLF